MIKRGKIWIWAHQLCGKTSPVPTRDLPDDVIMDILSRLPVESLLRFKCVCKSWFEIILSSQFTKLHLKKTYRIDDYANHRVIICSTKNYPRSPMMSLPLRSILLKPSYKLTWLNVPFNMDRPDFIVGSCNGLICIVTKLYEIILWNPSVRQYHGVLKDTSYWHPFVTHPSYGFFYDDNSDDYKVVFMYNRSTSIEFFAKLWSSRTNSWKNIQDCPSVWVKSTSGVAVKRKLHWISYVDNHYKIAALDLKSETFAEILLHDSVKNCRRFPVVTVYRTLLCVVCQYVNLLGKMKTHIWVMKEYGVKESWTKLFVLPHIKCPWPWYDLKNRRHLKYTSQLCIAGNGELILLRKKIFRHLVRRMSTLLLEEGKQIVHAIENSSVFYFRVPTFVDSLMSPCVGDMESTSSQFGGG